jgi:hypothetical protein
MSKVIDNNNYHYNNKTKQNKTKYHNSHMVFFPRIQLLHFMNDYMMSCTANQM